MTGAMASLGADVVMLVHLAFVLFVALGGLVVRRWRRLAWVHLPCAAYGAAIEVWGWVCPLTPLEQSLRRAAGQGGYGGGFVEHFVGGVLYPQDWHHLHLWLAAVVVVVNFVAYGLLWTRRHRGSS